MKKWILLALFIWYSWQDIRTHTITLYSLATGIVLGIGYQLLAGDITIFNMAAGLLAALGFYILSIITKGNVGTGDAVMMGIISIFGGAVLLMAVLGFSFLLMFLFSAAGLLLRRLTFKTTLPMAPFLCIAIGGFF